MAGGTKAYLHRVIARPGELKLCVESGYSINAALGNAQVVCNTFHRFRREIPQLALHRLKNRDEIVTVPRKAPKYVLQFSCHLIKVNLLHLLLKTKNSLYEFTNKVKPKVGRKYARP
jgi:hypothetical protein